MLLYKENMMSTCDVYKSFKDWQETDCLDHKLRLF